MEAKITLAAIGIVCLTIMELMALYMGIDGQIMLSVGAIIGGIIGTVFGVSINPKGYGQNTLKTK